jgi:hypothetical protein
MLCGSILALAGLLDGWASMTARRRPALAGEADGFGIAAVGGRDLRAAVSRAAELVTDGPATAALPLRVRRELHL